MDQARQAEEALAVEVKGQRANVARFAGRYQEALLVRSEIERSRKQLSDIDDRLDFIALEANAPGFVRIESRARPLDIPTKGGRTKLYILFLVAAVGVGLVVPIGLAILEAMAAGVPVLVADTGGAASLVDEGMSGFHFHANDAEALAQRLTDLAQASPAQLNSVVAGGYQALATRFSATARLADYRRLLEGGRR
jgi:glycosyltransferase involved in cell wall biosynthesis